MLHLEIMSKSLFWEKVLLVSLTKLGEHKHIPDVYHVKGLKHNLLSIGQLLQKGYRVYMEDNHYVIKDLRPSNQLIARVPMTSNRLFLVRIVPDST